MFANFELSFAEFSRFFEEFYGKTGFLTILELGFWLRTGFFKNLAIWVFQNSELGFWVLHKKKPATVYPGFFIQNLTPNSGPVCGLTQPKFWPNSVNFWSNSAEISS